MQSSPCSLSFSARPKVITLSVKQRAVLHRLLNRDLRKCSPSVLEACQRFGWCSGPGDGHALTAQGRRVAELSEQAPPEQKLTLDDRAAQVLPKQTASRYSIEFAADAEVAQRRFPAA